MSSEVLKKRKTKVLRSEAGTPELKRSRGEGDPDLRVYNEEAVLDSRNPEQDYAQYKDKCEVIANLMGEIQELKANGAKEGSVELEERRRECCIHFITLKKLNRLAHMRLKKSRDQTQDAKQRVDVLHLQLQNLLYEVMHLQKEISKCLEFKSQHEEIDLVSTEEFFNDAPDEISRPQLTKDDPHQLTLSRLDWELEQRKRLAEQYKTSLSSKEKILKGIEVKKEYLGSLRPGLQSIMQASLPLQEYLSMPFEQVAKQAEVARHLPPPLYVLLVQANAYGQACDKSLSVLISGDVDEARALSKPPEDSQDDESDSDAEEEQNTKRRRPTVGGQLDDKRKEMLKRHPLSLCLDLKCKDGNTLQLFFYYLMNLNILTVKARVSTAVHQSHAISAGELLNSETLLNCIYTSDTGKETPNPANRYQFDKVGILSFADYVADQGHPYLWVQSLGGLQFPSDNNPESVMTGSKLSASHMEHTMKLLRSRLQARLALHKQFMSLEKNIVPVTVECQHLFPAKVISRLTRWSAITYQEFEEMPLVQHVLKAGLAQDTDLYFMAQVERGTACLQAVVVLNPRYPDVTPLFSLCLLWKGERTGRTDDNLRAMESEVNVFRSELLGPRPGQQLLTNQLQRLCVCLDVYLETESQVCDGVEGPREFPREKMCLRTARGPNRLKPFKYNHPQGFFSHR
ncbi:THO complex subunit 5 homolog [Engraulis encrasicolus]|uniref:THO complex subunit 5 homolog n=1 Tax=Engraulis encrasicolus TaxID=184585 RepID=UPI002FD6C230